MTVKALPGSSLEVIETEFFFQLLVSLLGRRRTFKPEHPRNIGRAFDALGPSINWVSRSVHEKPLTK
jgi:hypothetical protein